METNLNKRTKVWILLMQLGAKTGCHQLHERSFCINCYQFPVCARCTGLFFGQISGVLLFFWYLKYNLGLLFILAIISVLLLGIDGFLQLKKIWMSTNYRRFITGVLCGFFVTCFNIKIISILITTVLT